MNNHIKKIKLILIKISILLKEGNYPDWGNSFMKFSEDIEINFEAVKNQILILYGGMGSFNDIVLHRNKKPLINENNRLDDLRTQLYKLLTNN
ncbi:DUF6966 domain-containing protein [Gilliamella sp. Pas-s25]|uniref:DUF6966 domain-containing protein n=1 Tax=Gilliamella sp. Pas-s25 TaxID=2687310 RepID=UPI00135E1C77|nr:hypothetical protein [Gilliamella sp. Pas-s25]MWP62259.1 hypothetical protein [Gilliamella sp. Pas-s25]